MKTKLTLVALILNLFVFGQELPDNYYLESFSTFHSFPMDLEFNNQGNAVVVERSGKLYQYNGNSVIEPPLLDITNQVTTYFERGVQSILIDKNYIYLYYTVEESYLFPNLNLPLSDDSATFNRVSRWLVDWENNTVGNEEIIVHNIPSLKGNHQGGGMAFGEGDELYISTGDNSSLTYAQQGADRGIIPQMYVGIHGKYLAQSIGFGGGKILRVNKNTGQGMPNNPYYEPTNVSSWQSRIFDYGYRNPFEIFYDNGKLYVADVGAGQREEITVAEESGNAGWGFKEGYNDYSFSSNQINPDTGFPYNQGLYTNQPLIDYGHIGNAETRILDNDGNLVIDNNAIEGNSITGGVIIKEGFGNLTGNYIFSDYTRGWLNMLAFDGDQVSYTQNFGGNNTVSNAIDITQAPDGSLYFVRLFGGIDRIFYDETLGIEEIEFNYQKATKEYYTINGQYIGKSLEYSSNGVYLIVYRWNGRIDSELHVKE